LPFVLAPAVVLEATFRPALEHRVGHALLGLAFVLPLHWRRSQPFRAFLASFALAATVPLAAILFGLEWTDLHTTAAILLLPYSLFRWGTGREASLGLAVISGLYGLTLVRGQFHGPGDALGGGVVMLFPALLGATVRFRAKAHLRELDTVRLGERAQIARELHDSVAHQLSAVALLAQGGIVVGANRPEEALKMLHLIEETAAKALGELRAMVGALRDDGAALGPQPRISDIEELASLPHESLRVTVDFDRDDETASVLEAIPPPVQGAVYRIAQEAITNARRHAKHANTVEVAVRANAASVTVTIVDDGQTRGTKSRDGLGFGLVGMAERAALLGGTLEAGPVPGGRGWRVAAAFPLRKNPS
jgi:signal transduction histidine kinase